MAKRTAPTLSSPPSFIKPPGKAGGGSASPAKPATPAKPTGVHKDPGGAWVRPAPAPPSPGKPSGGMSRVRPGAPKSPAPSPGKPRMRPPGSPTRPAVKVPMKKAK